MGSPNKSMPLTELSNRYKAIEESIRQLAKDAGLSEEQVAKSVTGRFRGYQRVGSTGGGKGRGLMTVGPANLKPLPEARPRPAQKAGRA